MQLLKTLLWTLIAVAILFATVAFVYANEQVVVLDLLFPSPFTIRLGHAVIWAFIFGGLMGLLSASLIIVRQRGDRVRLEKRLHSTTRLMSGM